jgi:hypothetical protein
MSKTIKKKKGKHMSDETEKELEPAEAETSEPKAEAEEMKE